MEVLVFGDSVTYGAWDSRGGWVQRLREFLEKVHGQGDIVYNLGVSGDTAEGVLERFDREAQARKEEGWGETLVIISIGGNDSAVMSETGKQVFSSEEFKQNLLKIIEKARKITNRIALVGLFPVDESRVSPAPWAPEVSYKNESIKEFNNACREVCSESGAAFIDLLPEIVGMDWKKLLEDGAHPNSKGHERIFGIVRDALIKKKMIS